MSKYKGLFTFDEDNHRYVPIAQADGIIDTMDYEPDSEPTEPLIKDEKVRKAVRAWAEANKINKCKCSDETHCITFETERGMFISFEYAVPIPPEGNFTIAELCGEEEE